MPLLLTWPQWSAERFRTSLTHTDTDALRVHPTSLPTSLWVPKGIWPTQILLPASLVCVAILISKPFTSLLRRPGRTGSSRPPDRWETGRVVVGHRWCRWAVPRKTVGGSFDRAESSKSQNKDPALKCPLDHLKHPLKQFRIIQIKPGSLVPPCGEHTMHTTLRASQHA